jgi:UDP-GlcNAc:undecaprenyl-phosphate GlcNAc-1-phosphate transferase
MTLARVALVAVAAFATGLPAGWIARRLAWRTNFLAQPNPLVASHRCAVPYLGGLAIALAMLVAGAWCARDSILAPAVPALAFLGLGLADDRLALAPAPKFGLQVLAAVLAVVAGARGAFTGLPLLDGMLSALWILVLVNAFNFVDVCDGLLAGLALVFFAFALVAIPRGGDLAALASGATLALLTANRPPARIYLGDAGSHLLGFLAAWLCLSPGPGARTLARDATALAIPLAELVFITSVRIAKGLPWWKGSPDHFALRLQARGWSSWRVDVAAWAAAASFAAAGILWPHLGRGARTVTVVGGVGLLAGTAVYLLRAGPGGDPGRPGEPAA